MGFKPSLYVRKRGNGSEFSKNYALVTTKLISTISLEKTFFIKYLNELWLDGKVLGRCSVRALRGQKKSF